MYERGGVRGLQLQVRTQNQGKLPPPPPWIEMWKDWVYSISEISRFL